MHVLGVPGKDRPCPSLCNSEGRHVGSGGPELGSVTVWRVRPPAGCAGVWCGARTCLPEGHITGWGGGQDGVQPVAGGMAHGFGAGCFCVRGCGRGSRDMARAAKGGPQSIILGQTCHLVTILFPLPPLPLPPPLPLLSPSGHGPWRYHPTRCCLRCLRPAGASAPGRHFPPRSPRPAC